MARGRSKPTYRIMGVAAPPVVKKNKLGVYAFRCTIILDHVLRRDQKVHLRFEKYDKNGVGGPADTEFIRPRPSSIPITLHPHDRAPHKGRLFHVIDIEIRPKTDTQVRLVLTLKGKSVDDEEQSGKITIDAT